MSVHKFGYSAESLQKDKIENLEKRIGITNQINQLKTMICKAP